MVILVCLLMVDVKGLTYISTPYPLALNPSGTETLVETDTYPSSPLLKDADFVALKLKDCFFQSSEDEKRQ